MSLTRIITVLGAAIVLGAVNFAILGKERIRREGEVVLLELAPVDPRSLMQGDYMALRFRLANDLQGRLQREGGTKPLREGETARVAILVDEKGIATLAPPGAPRPLEIGYRIRRGAVWIGTNAFFFEEGSDRLYSSARYGEFRLDRESGEAVLVGLRDAQLRALGPA